MTDFLQNLRGPIDVNLLWEYVTSNETHPASDEAVEYFAEYGATVASVGILGTIFAVCQILFIVFFLIGRCVFNKCGGKEPSEEKIADGYTGFEILIPCGCYIFLGVFSIALAILAAIFIGDTSFAIGDLKVAINNTLNNATEFTTDILVSINDIDMSLDNVIVEVEKEFAGTSFVEDGVESLLNSANSFINDTSSIHLPLGCDEDETLTEDDICLPCTYCKGPMIFFFYL